MPTNAVISIETKLGTAQLIVDAAKAKAIIRDFGQSTRSSMVASSAALRELEGNFANNNRAIARFLGDTLKLGPVLQAAFPLLGGLAFGSLLVELGTKTYKFFKDMQEAPKAITEAFRKLDAPLRSTNAELAVTNARLENDIAKLEGRRQNNLKVGLLESAAAADKLANSLDNAVNEVLKLQKEQAIGAIKGFIFGKATTGADTEDTKKLQESLRKVEADETDAISATMDKLQTKKITELEAQKQISAAQKAGNDAALKLLDDEVSKYKVLVAGTEKLQQLHEGIGNAPTWLAYQEDLRKPEAQRQYTGYNTSVSGRDQSGLLAEQKGKLQEIKDLRNQIALTVAHTTLEQRKQNDEINRDNSKDTERPFENRIAELDAKLAGVKVKLAAIGQDESFQIQAKATAEADKAITEINDALKRRFDATKQGSPALSSGQEAQIRSRELAIANGESQSEWATKLDETTKKIKDQASSQELLTAAIGRGYEAVKKASVETQLMKDLGPEKYNQLLRDNATALTTLRSAAGAAYDAQSAEKTASQTHTLQDQIEMEKRLATVQIEGAAAVRYMTLQVELEQRARQGGIGIEKELGAIREKFNAEQANATAKDLATIGERTSAIKRLIAAQVEGGEAVRKANLESKYEEIRRKGGTQVPNALIQGLPEGTTVEELNERAKDNLEYQQEIGAKVGERVNLYKNELESLAAQKAELLSQIGSQQANVEQVRALKELNDEILKAQIAQNLAIGTAKSGVTAFFEEMQKQAKQASDILYEALNSALDKTSDQLSRLLTGKKTQFGKMLDEIGTSILREAVKSGLQKGLGSLGKVIDPKGTAQRAATLAKAKADQEELKRRALLRPIGNASDPFHVLVDNGSQQQSSTGGVATPNGTSGAKAGSLLQRIGNGITSAVGLFGRLSGGGGGGDNSDGGNDSDGGGASDGIPADGGGMAVGGYMSADKSYIVGESGPELVRGTSARVFSNAETRHMLGGGTNVTYHVDARGSDIGAGARTRHALEATHTSAVANSQKVAAENRKRMPQRAA